MLLIQRGTRPEIGAWSLPGGRVEAGETMINAMTREVHEETGLIVTAGDLIGWVELISDHSHFVICDFWAVEADPHVQPTAGTDAQRVGFFSLTELWSLPMVAGLLAFLADHGVLEHLGTPGMSADPGT